MIGLICDHDSLVLAGRMVQAGYKPLRLTPAQLLEDRPERVIAWVVDCIDSSPVADAMESIEEQVLVLSNRPDPSAPVEYHGWCERIVNTLDRWSADHWHASNNRTNTSPGDYAAVQAVWIIAGSTGGIPAAAEFFGAFTHVPPVAFVYAQHIGPHNQNMLTTVGHSNPGLRCTLALGRHWLNPGHVLIVPAACRLKFSRGGEVFSVRDDWGNRETPNIDGLMLTMSGLNPSPAGAIVFSGNGSDGAGGARALATMGTRIWAQNPETAVAPSMPRSVIATGMVERSAEPGALAAEFMKLYPR